MEKLERTIRYELDKYEGLALRKSRTRNREAADYGTYMVVDARSGAMVMWGFQSGFGLTLADICDELERMRDRRLLMFRE